MNLELLDSRFSKNLMNNDLELFFIIGELSFSCNNLIAEGNNGTNSIFLEIYGSFELSNSQFK